MRPVTVTQTGVGNSALIVHDYLQTPANISLSTVVTGTVNYTVQHTFDDIFAANYNPSTGNWYNHDNADLVASSINANDNYAYPVRASRVVVNSGTGSVALTVIQGNNR